MKKEKTLRFEMGPNGERSPRPGRTPYNYPGYANVQLRTMEKDPPNPERTTL